MPFLYAPSFFLYKMSDFDHYMLFLWKKNSFGQKDIFAFVEKMFHKHPQNSSSQEFGFTLTVSATTLFPLTRSEYNH